MSYVVIAAQITPSLYRISAALSSARRRRKRSPSLTRSAARRRSSRNTDEMQQSQDKDVVIIGNGPSGICLSYLLAGNWPHYTGSAHPGDEMLTARLRYSVATQTSADDSAVACPVCRGTVSSATAEASAHPSACLAKFSARPDLEFLAAGLEGRNGGKPLSLLMDKLQHPCLDAGMDEESLLHWTPPEEHAEHRVTDHVVLGKGPPGGAWHALDPNVLTISLNRWMSLPGLDLRNWAEGLEADERERKLVGCDREVPIGAGYNAARVPIGTVAAYYEDYVRKMGLGKYFRCGTVVTSVKPGAEGSGSADYGWKVQGYETETGKQFEYRCRRVVLATGTTDSSNRLGVSGEQTYNWVTHDFKDLERKLDKLGCKISDNYDSEQIVKSSSLEPVLIVGSGLSAADAIMAARGRGVAVLHVFRNSSQDRSAETTRRSLDRLQWLPASVYPEYHAVYEMMADRGRHYPLYKSLPDHVVVDFSAGADKLTRTKTRKVTLCTPQGRLVSYRVSFAAVLIGSKPDLSFLQRCGSGLGKLHDKPIDSRSNQIEVDPFSYEVEKAPRKGLYAIGPLAGDNFVRFILGGAFGVLASIVNSEKEHNTYTHSHAHTLS
ncbi:oxidative stress-induced growth inhibitor 1-like isoform X2 [Phymastichus coffea]|uniref:oxidative stress-induced growth inhibitor 1-like isoform X2 n=1 Tax=Phymastichus coffea TaxID=108790 RepID=UPI00273B06C1|nr:oxidative stress-induced growth inhibitor 1-like isoform X2 [Phymastichus coffea]